MFTVPVPVMRGLLTQPRATVQVDRWNGRETEPAHGVKRQGPNGFPPPIIMTAFPDPGTHSHRRLLLSCDVGTVLLPEIPGVWVPAFAGTTPDIDGSSPIRLPWQNKSKPREANARKIRMSFVLPTDQGTTSPRAIVFGSDISIAASAQAEFPQYFPASGWVEHEPEDIWTSTMATCREALNKAGVGPKDIAAIGITNQRETTVVWDRATGNAVHRAIVWQDRRTADICARLKTEVHEPVISAKTGLIIDPYFSRTKVAWILDHVPGARARAERGELLFGTVDCYLLWRLTGGKVHATDATNASRTLLFNIHTGQWDDELLKILRVPKSMLPEVKDSSHP